MGRATCEAEAKQNASDLKHELEAISALACEHFCCDMTFVENSGGETVLEELAEIGGDVAVITEIAIRADRALKLLEEKP